MQLEPQTGGEEHPGGTSREQVKKGGHAHHQHCPWLTHGGGVGGGEEAPRLLQLGLLGMTVQGARLGDRQRVPVPSPCPQISPPNLEVPDREWLHEEPGSLANEGGSRWSLLPAPASSQHRA